MKAVGLVLALCVASVAPSPHAQYVEQLKENLGGRFSDNIYEDARLDVLELVRKYGYPLEEHSVTTEDGYILTMHRIPHGRDANNVPDPRKPVVIVMHGLLCSSADFVLMGPGSGLGYILAEEGFDVWLGNVRGNYYSRRHVRLNPDSVLNPSFWNFSFDEIGNIDLPTMIDYVLVHTRNQRLHYIGHSQGTTAFFVMGSLRPDYNKKIISMQAMAPVAYMGYNRNPLLNILAPYSKDISTMLPVILGHSPAGSSVSQLVHYAQSIVDKGFRRFDHGALTNIRLYGRTSPPSYDLSKVTAPVFLHYSDNDALAEVPDVMRLFRELGAPMGAFRVPLASFNHIDHMWGIDARTLVYNRIINLMRSTK